MTAAQLKQGEEVQLAISVAHFPGILRDRLRAATPETRRAVFGAFAVFAVATLVALVDAVTGSPGQEPFRLIGIVLAAFAFFLRATSTLLWRVGADTTARNTGGEWARSPELNRAMHAVPDLNAVAAVLFGIAAGLFLPSVATFVPFAAVVATLLFFAIASSREVMGVAQTLYAHMVDLRIAADRERAAASDARLAALQSQMNPHFLFNALNTVASLVRTDQRRAERTVESLSAVLRRTLDRSERRWVTLRDELDFVREYLAVEQERWGAALHMEWSVDATTLDAEVPVMSLQPLVENALIHGLGQRIDGGRLQIAARRSDVHLELIVRDDGPGFSSELTERTGLGNLRRRLAALYGDDAQLVLEHADGFTSARLRIPLSTSPSSAS